MTHRVCENCAAQDDELLLVRRVYLLPDPAHDEVDGHLGSLDARPARMAEKVVEPPELWCIPCVTMYPCRPADD